jgi:hypothetical protein
MKRWVAVGLVLGSSLLLAGCISEQYAQYRTRHRVLDSTAVMTTPDVVAMVKAGVKTNVIVNLLKKSETDFRLGPTEIIALADSGVSDTVINAMIDREGAEGSSGNGERYYARPSFYWYPWYGYGDPWYSPFYFDLWYGGYPYYYGSRWHIHSFGPRFRTQGLRGSGVVRGSGRRR